MGAKSKKQPCILVSNLRDDAEFVVKLDTKVKIAGKIRIEKYLGPTIVGSRANAGTVAK